MQEKHIQRAKGKKGYDIRIKSLKSMGNLRFFPLNFFPQEFIVPTELFDRSLRSLYLVLIVMVVFVVQPLNLGLQQQKNYPTK